MGLLRANYEALPQFVKEALSVNFQRLRGQLNEPEVCSSLHGLAKTEARWDLLPLQLQAALLGSAVGLESMDPVGLACAIYSLGLLGAKWDHLPPGIAQHLVSSSRALPLTDRALSNVIYGLSLMQAEWDTLQPDVKAALVHDLARPAALARDNPQHVSNILWALGKMDATWKQLPGSNILTALRRCADAQSHQETANAMYGLAIVDVAWAELDLPVIVALERAVLRNIALMTIQVTSTNYVLKFI